MSFIRIKLHNTEEEKEKLYEQLVAAEKRADRLQSKTIATIYPQSSIPQDDRKSEELTETPPPSAVSGSVNWWEFRPFLIADLLL